MGRGGVGDRRPEHERVRRDRDQMRDHVNLRKTKGLPNPLNINRLIGSNYQAQKSLWQPQTPARPKPPSLEGRGDGSFEHSNRVSFSLRVMIDLLRLARAVGPPQRRDL